MFLTFFSQKNSARLCVSCEGHLWRGNYYSRSCGGATGSSAPPAQWSRTGAFAVSKIRSKYVSTEPLEISFHWSFYYVILETQVNFYNLTLKMKLVLVGIDPYYVGFTAMVPTRSHWTIGGIVYLIILLCSSRNAGFFFNFNIENETGVGRDRSRWCWIYCYGVDTIPLSHWRYRFTDYFIIWF